MAQNWVCKVLRYILVLWPMFYAETQEYVLASIVAHISIFFLPKFHCRAWKQGCCSVIIIIINHCHHPNIFHPHETHICIFLRQSIFSHQDMMQVARLSFAKFCKSLTLTWNVADKFIIEQIDWSFSWATFQFQLL